MTGFTKLFSGLVHSTVWREEMHVKVVWITMLAMSDRNGFIAASLPGLADASRVTMEQCQDALAHLAAPDPYSRTKAHEGRRIQESEGGWMLLNYLKYRELQSKDERRIAVRDAVSRHRARNHVKSDVINGKQSKHIAEAEAEAKAEAGTATTQARPGNGVVRTGTALRRFEEVVGYLKAVDAETVQRFDQRERQTFDVRGVFAYWATKFGHKKAMLDTERDKAIRKALRANGENVSELLYAVKGASADDWARADLGRHDVTVLFRDRSHVEKYATKCEAYKRGEPHPFTAKLVGASDVEIVP